MFGTWRAISLSAGAAIFVMVGFAGADYMAAKHVSSFQRPAGLAETASQTVIFSLAAADGLDNARLAPDSGLPGSLEGHAEPRGTAAAAIIDRDQIMRLQTALGGRGYDPGPIDGLLGSRTRAAIRAYQRDSDVPADGEASQGLLDRLRAATAPDVGPEAVHVVPTSGGADGTSGRNLFEIESLLNHRGYDVGLIDGLADTRTVDAIRAYQRDAELDVTGHANAGLVTHLRTSRVSANNGADRIVATLILWMVGDNN